MRLWGDCVGEIVGIIVGRLVAGFDVGLILIVGASVVSAVHHEKGSEVATHPLAVKYASPCGLELNELISCLTIASASKASGG